MLIILVILHPNYAKKIKEILGGLLCKHYIMYIYNTPITKLVNHKLLKKYFEVKTDKKHMFLFVIFIVYKKALKVRP